MNHPEEFLVPMTLFVTLGIIFYKYFHYRHAENMAMIERGISVGPRKPEKPVRSRSTTYLMLGMLATFIGIAFVGGLMLTTYVNVDEAIIPALMLVAGGLAMLATYGVAHKEEEKREKLGLER